MTTILQPTTTSTHITNTNSSINNSPENAEHFQSWFNRHKCNDYSAACCTVHWAFIISLTRIKYQPL